MSRYKWGQIIVPLIVALITLLGSVAAAYISLQGQIHSNADKLSSLRVLGLQVGQVEMSEYNDRQFTLATPRTDQEFRRVTRHVVFSSAFSAPPVVMLSLSELDIGNESHIRLLTFPTNITSQGFDLNVQTWNQTEIHTVQVQWMAVETLSNQAAPQ